MRLLAPAALGFLVAPLLACLGMGGETYASTRNTIAATDAAALDALLADAGRSADDLVVVPASEWSAGGESAVVVEGARVTHLRLRRAGLVSMAGVAPLDALRELDLSDNAVTRIEGLGGARALEVLSLRNNALGDLGGLEGCAALRWLYVDGNRVTSLATLAPLPALQDLSLNANTLTTLDGIAGRRALTGLYVANNELIDLSGLRDVPALATLTANANRIARLDALAGAPALRNVSLAQNAIVDAAALAALPALAWVDLTGNPVGERPAVGAGVEVVGVVVGAAEAPGTPFTSPDGREGSASSPPTEGGSVTFGRSSRGRGLGGVSASGSMGTLSGTACPSFGKGAEVYGIRVKVSVETGRVRVWVRDGDVYRWMRAEPGRPAEIAGAPLRRPAAIHGEARYQICIESIDGGAAGVTYQVERG